MVELQALSAKLTRDKTSLTAELTTLRDELGCCCCGAGGSTTRSPAASPIGTPGVVVVGLLLALMCAWEGGRSHGPHAGHCVQRAHRVVSAADSSLLPQGWCAVWVSGSQQARVACQTGTAALL